MPKYNHVYNNNLLQHAPVSRLAKNLGLSGPPRMAEEFDEQRGGGRQGFLH